MDVVTPESGRAANPVMGESTVDRTLMRPPVVQRQTPPGRGLLGLFPPASFWRRHPLATCSAGVSLGWRDHHVAAPHTYGGSRAIVIAMAESRCMVVCALATALYPPPVLLNRGAAQRCAPVRSRCGCGAAHRHQASRAPGVQERPQASTQTRRVRGQRRGAPARAQTQEVPPGRARWSG
jgi:hypothetical protein